VIAVYIQENGETRSAERVEPEWLDPASRATFWVDIAPPTADEMRLLSDVFHFHPLAIEDAQSTLQYPKIETYQGYLYLVLHGIHLKADQRHFVTHDVDFFVGRNFLVSIHDGTSRSIAKMHSVCNRNSRVLAEGSVGVLHRIVDSMVDHYRPVVEEIEAQIERLEEQAFTGHDRIVRQVLKLKRELAAMRRVIPPQRDAIGRLARREFTIVSDEMAYRFRDVYDHVVRLSEETFLFQDRVTGILEVNLATVSNRLNQVMKVLTVMSTIFLPLTVLTGMWGMNITLPRFPGGDGAQFWWIGGIMAAIASVMLAIFRRLRWI
jgi:magnesium transporter